MNRCQLGLTHLPPHLMAHYFRQARARFLAESAPKDISGTGIIICGGGRYEQWALNNCRYLRSHSPDVAIQVWSLDAAEIRQPEAFLVLGVELHSCSAYLTTSPMRRFSGWHSKIYAILHSRLRNVLFLDADCFVNRAGVELVHHPDFVKMGAIFCTDVKKCRAGDEAYVAAGLAPPLVEWETGAFWVDKARHWTALRLANWMAEHSEVWWHRKSLHGDKGSTEISFRSVGNPVGLCAGTWEDYGIDHKYEEKSVFRHLLGCKRGQPVPEDLKNGQW